LQIGRTGLFSDKTTAANDVLDSKYGHVRESRSLFKKPIFISSLVALTIILLVFYLLIFGQSSN
jgi:hypothetical protein